MSLLGQQLLIPTLGGQTLDDFIATLSPLMDGRFTETSGDPVNYGSLGDVFTLSGCTQGEPGLTENPGAIYFDGVDDYATFPAKAAFGDLVEYEIAVLVKTDTSLAESPAIIHWDDGGTRPFIRANSTGMTSWSVWNSSSSPPSPESTATFSINPLPAGEWRWVFGGYDVISKVSFMYIGGDGSVSPPDSYSAQPVAGGDLSMNVAAGMILGNNNVGGSRTFKGWWDRWLWIPRVLTPAERQRIVTLSGA